MTEGSDPRAEQRVGSVLNEKWTLEHLIGAGGMGAVYAARHRNGARSALKILHPDLARIPEVRERFLREGYAANRVDHRGAVQVLDDDIVKSGPDEGTAYLVMELLEGEALQERAMRKPKLVERELLEIMDAVLDVLAAAHDHGVVHRDLKPENIFLAKDPERDDGVRVKVLDFGLARIAEASGVTSAGMAVGTPSFMSPEQAAGRSLEIDGRTDVFALGATIFRIVTGKRIHDAQNMVQLVVLMATNPAPRIRTIAPDLSEAFARVVDGALAFERSDRFDARAMQSEIRFAMQTIARDSGSASENLQVIPFSARSVRATSSAELAPLEAEAAAAAAARAAKSEPPAAKAKSDPPPVPKAKTKSDPPAAATSDPPEAAPESGRPERKSVPSVSPRALPARAIAKSATLPWVIVLLLLAIGAWRLLPSLQEELVRRASFLSSAAPTPPATTTTPDVSDASAATTAAHLDTDNGDAAALAVNLDLEDGGDPYAMEDPVDAGDSLAAEESHDAGPPHPVASARPHAGAPHAAKPTGPGKKPLPPRKRKR